MTVLAGGGPAEVAAVSDGPAPAPPTAWGRARSALPTWGLVVTKNLELRRRRGLMVAVVLLIFGLPAVILGIRLLFHAIDPASYGPAGSPGVFAGLCGPMAEFGFIIAATLGTAAGTTDLTEGVFRQLVTTGRSRLALYLARIPAGLAILLPLVALAFSVLCLVTCFAGIPQRNVVSLDGVSVPAHLSEGQLERWVEQHPGQVAAALRSGAVPLPTKGTTVSGEVDNLYGDYVTAEALSTDPAINEMVKIGLWIELEVGVGFLVGLGLGSLIGQRTVATIAMIALEIIVTPILANVAIPYFLDGQRLVVGIAMDQLRPAGLATALGEHVRGRVLLGGRGVLSIPPMPTWAMISVIAGWIVGWSAIGAWKMMRRDA